MRTSRGDGRSGTTKGHRNGTRNREGETKEGGRKDRSASSLGARLSDKAIKSLTVQVEVGQDSDKQLIVIDFPWIRKCRGIHHYHW